MDSSSLESLSRKDAITLLEMISESLVCTTEEKLSELMGRLSEPLPFRAALSCISNIDPITDINELQVVNVSYPVEYLRDIFNTDLIWKDPIVIEQFKRGNCKLRR